MKTEITPYCGDIERVDIMDKYKNIPESLKQEKQWVCFKMEFNEKKGKNDKIPKDPKTGYNAKAGHPKTWSDYQTAVNAIEKFHLDGLGFEFANGIFGVDLDHVIENGVPTVEANDIISALDSYTEISPSGTGVHILCKGTIPEKNRRKGNVEMYSSGRFFTVTGNIYGTQKEIQERTAQAAAVHKKYLQRDEMQKTCDTSIHDLSYSDDELIKKAISAKNGDSFRALWNGDISAYSDDHSAADQALCNKLAYWTNGNAYRMDTLFKQSGLMRDKWNERHGQDTYGNITIAEALTNFTPYVKNEYSVSIGAEKKAVTSEATPAAAKAKNNSLELYQEESQNATDAPRPDAVSNYLDDMFVKDIDRFMSFKDRKTGFENLDKNCGGLYPGLYVIGAISSLGKTTFIHQMGDQLAEAGDHVLYFTLEQNKLEMVTKSLSRISARHNKQTAVSAINIRAGKLTNEVWKAADEYSKVADRVSIVECNFNTNINFIIDYTKKYIKANGVKPVVIVDYLQIIPPTDPRQSDKEKVDNIVRGLKKLQSENDLVLFAVSSINRTNYLTPIDFESFKESGGIEYTADVVWGLQLQVLNDDVFNSDKKIKEKREKVKEAKKQIPRKLELVCLKNRYGISSYDCGFNYFPQFDLFEIDQEYEYRDELQTHSMKRL